MTGLYLLFAKYRFIYKFWWQVFVTVMFSSSFRNFRVTVVSYLGKPLTFRTLKASLVHKREVTRRMGWSRIGYRIGRCLASLPDCSFLIFWHGNNIRLGGALAEINNHYTRVKCKRLSWELIYVVPRLSYGFTRGKKYPRRKRRVRKNVIRHFKKMM